MPGRGCAYSTRRWSVDALRRRRARHAVRTGRGAGTGRPQRAAKGILTRPRTHRPASGPTWAERAPAAGRRAGQGPGAAAIRRSNVLRRANNRIAAMDDLPHGGTNHRMAGRAFWKCMIINDWCDAARIRLNLT